jgi:membrane protein YdbS with pleckstrin-like domain
VDELFAPPGNDWQPVSPALATMRRIRLAVAAVVLVAVLAIGGTLLDLPAWSWTAVVVVVLGAAAFGWVLIGRNARWWGYAERDEDLFIKHGALFRTLVVVPYGRMQYVDVQAGPLEQVFKIASVHFHTATPQTSARIPGLPAAEAARLRDRMTVLGESRAAGL